VRFISLDAIHLLKPLFHSIAFQSLVSGHYPFLIAADILRYHEQMPFIINSFLNGQGASMSTYTDGMPMSDASLINDTTTLVLHMEAGRKHLLRIVGACATFQHFISFGTRQKLFQFIGLLNMNRRSSHVNCAD
jgi:hypothetical protein